MKFLLKSLRPALFLLVLIAFSGCEKYVTPNKVKRMITSDSWQVTTLIVGNQLITNQYANIELDFGDGGVLTILDVPNVKGHYNVGIAKKPTRLYISGVLVEPYSLLNDDWDVLTCTKTRLTLESDNGTHVNQMIINRVED